jgi:ribosomal protein S18 acetylase RimI-like enzyme
VSLVAAAGPVERLDGSGFDAAIDDLAQVLRACVLEGASVGFTAPFTLDAARAYWLGLRASVRRGERAVLAVRDTAGRVVGTVQVVPAGFPNGSHRAEIAKLLVHPRARRGGLGTRLMRAAEEAAATDGRTLLVLDTATDAAERLYLGLGWVRAGCIPGYARTVHGTALDATTIMYKHLPERSTAAAHGIVSRMPHSPAGRSRP